MAGTGVNVELSQDALTAKISAQWVGWRNVLRQQFDLQTFGS
jgi:hypothetical protein